MALEIGNWGSVRTNPIYRSEKTPFIPGFFRPKFCRFALPRNLKMDKKFFHEALDSSEDHEIGMLVSTCVRNMGMLLTQIELPPYGHSLFLCVRIRYMYCKCWDFMRFFAHIIGTAICLTFTFKRWKGKCQCPGWIMQIMLSWNLDDSSLAGCAPEIFTFLRQKSTTVGRPSSITLSKSGCNACRHPLVLVPHQTQQISCMCRSDLRSQQKLQNLKVRN